MSEQKRYASALERYVFWRGLKGKDPERDEALAELAALRDRAARLESALRWCRGNLTEDEHEAREIIDEALLP